MAAYTTIDDPEAYFQVQLYAGDGAANNSITLGGDTDMQPDLVWIKNRSAADSHCLFDAVRGATKLISSDSTAAESTDTDTLDSFASDGFQVDADVKVNTNAENYVAWCWKESATAGFDIVSYTGNVTARTIAHSLSAVPTMIIVRNRSIISNWPVYHAILGNDKDVYLDITDAIGSADFWNATTPTSSVFSIKTQNAVNGDGNAMIAYCFAPKQGYSKFGTFTGNGNADGAFVYTGFRPAFVMCKRTDTTDNWAMLDNKRPGINVRDELILADLAQEAVSNTDGSTDACDFFSNGFKARTTSTWINASGGTYVYMAFAEAPFVNSNGVPCNAR